ncbi:transcriptional regulator, GntR family [Alkalispirochaeta americana]|uniref:Transcriptional regulator, GntR family n=1 Tax=Alkalispirochaeta americana TaxID=159291 RepID=A0A1N6RG56_9SPIO|nr:GntR family transcriptional regulator [Alkalispirochaeta americana]SIQ27811.1 transcriptional regulator, GntR family [Alkalispirochaeta americana]
MKDLLNEESPLFRQIKEEIEDQIVDGRLKEDSRIPSTTELVQFYRINHVTAARGINLLVEQGVLYKKRGIGVFVASGAQEKLREARRRDFPRRYLEPLLREAARLNISDQQILALLKNFREDTDDDL